ncbi:hypothetical protein KY284_030110 [Solanum tuberosum]|nr:hypothetical protein KY284_030110 [Solanum tuberosum]
MVAAQRKVYHPVYVKLEERHRHPVSVLFPLLLLLLSTVMKRFSVEVRKGKCFFNHLISVLEEKEMT